MIDNSPQARRRRLDEMWTKPTCWERFRCWLIRGHDFTYIGNHSHRCAVCNHITYHPSVWV